MNPRAPASPHQATAPDARPEALGRPLTNAERACWLIDQQAPLTIVFVAHLAGPLDPDALRRALDDVTAAHPLLRVGIVPGYTTYFRASARPVPLRVLARRDDHDWTGALAEERAAPLDTAEGPLARLTLLRGEDRSELLLTTHHGISDGLSGVYIVRDLLTALARSPAGLPSYPLRPGVEDLLPAPLRGWSGLPARLAYLLSQLGTLLRRPRKLHEEARVLVERRVGFTRHARLDAATAGALLARCRAEGTTVHAAIVAAALRALATHLGAPALLGCCTPVNLRGKLAVALGEEVGLYVGPVVHFHEVAPDAALWPLAREVRAALSAAIDAGLPAVALLTQSALLPRRATPALAAGMLYHPLFGALAVTNMGAPDIPVNYGAIALERLHIATPTAALGSLLSLAVLTLRGEISVNFNTNAEIVSEATIDALVVATLAGLAELAGPGVDAAPAGRVEPGRGD